MSNLLTIPLEDGYESSLAQQWDGATGTVYVNATPSFTVPSGQTFYVVVEPLTSNMQIAECDGYNPTTKTFNVTNITLEKGASVSSIQKTHAVNSKIIISDNYQTWKDILTAVNSKTDKATGNVTAYANAAARDAAIPSPVNGMQVYLIAEGYFTDYVGGSWQARASGVNPNASETVAGKVEIATQTEVNAGTDTGGTGAIVAVIPSTLKASLALNGGITGEIKIWTVTTPPTNWLICDGSAIDRTTYSDLFGVIGTIYGVGDGSTTFNIPNLKGKVVVGFNSAETEFDALGETGGEKTHTLDETEIPAHTHNISSNAGSASGSSGRLDATAYNNTTVNYTTDGGTGGGLAHNNLQPYITMNYIIKT